MIVKNYNPFEFFYALLDETPKKVPEILDVKFPEKFLKLLKNQNYYPDELNDKNILILSKIFLKLILKHQFHGMNVNLLYMHYCNFWPVII